MKKLYFLIVSVTVLLSAQMARADQVLIFDRFIVDRTSVEVFAENRQGKLMLKVAFGSGLAAKYLQLLYKENDGSPEAAKALGKLLELLRDEKISKFSDAEFTTRIGLQLDRVLGANE